MTPDLPRRRLRMPAEWEPQEAVWLAWPHDPLTWVAGIEAAEDAYISMVRALADVVRVDLLVTDARMEQRVAERLTDEAIAGVRLHVADHQDSWLRDTGPTFVHDLASHTLVGLDWRFNAWGNKYDTLLRDDRLAHVITEAAGVDRERIDVVLEGGAIEVNGVGTVLTTEQCLLNPNRNPELDRPAIEAILARTLGAPHVIWLGDGVEGDDTDGHIDDIARFVGPRTVVTAIEEDPSHPNHAPLAENAKRLAKATDQAGDPLEVIELPMPTTIEWEGQPVPSSYANFLISNGVVLLPVFDDPADARARRVLQRCLPKHRIVPIDARALVVGMGACHCLSQQQPATLAR